MATTSNNILQKIDWQIIAIYVFLVFAGWFNIYSAVFDENASSIFDVSQKYGKQLIWIGCAFLFATFIILIDSGVYFTFSFVAYGIVVVLLIAVRFLAKEVNGAHSWFDIGPVRFQPSEFAKLATALAVSKFLGNYGKKITRFSDWSRVAIIMLIPAALIVWQGDAGSALVFSAFLLMFYREGMPLAILLVGIGLVVIFSSAILFGSELISVTAIILGVLAFCVYGMQKRHKFSPITLGCVALAFAVPLVTFYIFDLKEYEFLLFLAGFVLTLIPLVVYSFKKRAWTLVVIFGIGLSSVLVSQSVEYVFDNVLETHQQKRIKVFFGMESDPRGSEFNVNQSKIAIGSGDWAGKGFLQGTQTKNDFVPEQSTDFIFCTIGEEWGFLGSCVVIGLFAYLIIHIMKIAERQRTRFSRIYGYCVASILFFHVIINIGMTIGLMPVIGIPLPFFSYGGSSLWAFTFLLFIFVKLDVNRDELIQ